MAKIGLSQQIQEVDREIGMRRQVYPGWVSIGKLRQGEAQHLIEIMDAVSNTLRWIQGNEQLRRAYQDQIGKGESLAGPHL